MSMRTPVATAIAAAALVHAGTSFGGEATSRAPYGPSSQPPSPPLRVEAPTERPSTTTTTSARYAPVRERVVTERTVDRLPNSDMLSTGTGLFIISYGGSAVAGALSDRPEDKKLFIPVAGPWMDLAGRSCTEAMPCGPNEDISRALIVTSGIVQGIGALLTLGSLVIPESTTTVHANVRPVSTSAPEVRVTPLSFRAGVGVGAVGRF